MAEKNFGELKNKISQSISMIEMRLMNIRQEEENEDIYLGISPFVLSMMQYFNATASIFQDTNPEAKTYFNFLINHINTIDSLLEKYDDIKPVYRIPTIYSKNNKRAALIDNLQMINQSVQNHFQIMISKQDNTAQNKESNLVMSAPKNDRHVFIPAPVYKEEYFKWNLTNPICKGFDMFYQTIRNSIIWFFKSFLFKLIIFGCIAFGVWNYWGPISSLLASEEEPVAVPYEVLKNIHREVLNNNTTDEIYSQVYAIASSKVSGYPNTKFAVNTDFMSISGTYNASQCRQTLDFYELFFKEAELTINKIKITNRVPYSNYAETKFNHPGSYYCNENNNVLSLKISYAKAKEYNNSTNQKKDWVESLIEMERYYQEYKNQHAMNYFQREQKPLALAHVEALKGSNEYAFFVNKVSGKFLNEKIK